MECSNQSGDDFDPTEFREVMTEGGAKHCGAYIYIYIERESVCVCERERERGREREREGKDYI